MDTQNYPSDPVFNDTFRKLRPILVSQLGREFTTAVDCDAFEDAATKALLAMRARKPKPTWQSCHAFLYRVARNDVLDSIRRRNALKRGGQFAFEEYSEENYVPLWQEGVHAADWPVSGCRCSDWTCISAFRFALRDVFARVESGLRLREAVVFASIIAALPLPLQDHGDFTYWWSLPEAPSRIGEILGDNVTHADLAIFDSRDTTRALCEVRKLLRNLPPEDGLTAILGL